MTQQAKATVLFVTNGRKEIDGIRAPLPNKSEVEWLYILIIQVCQRRKWQIKNEV